MRLCFIANANSIHTRRWIEPFLRRGDEVHLLSYARVETPWPEATCIDLTKLPGPPKGKLYHWVYWVRGYLQRVQPDILHAHQVTIAGWLGALTGFHPFVISAWGSDLLMAPQHSLWQRWKTQFAIRRCDRLITPSSLLKEAALQLGAPPSRIHVIPWGVETEIFSPTPMDRDITRKAFGIHSDAHVILSPRGLRPLYNHDIVIDAVAQLIPEFPSLHLCFLDFNPDVTYKEALQQKILNLNLTDRVSWLPPQPDRSAMARLYRMADTVISIPSSEGYGFSVYEALACGTPAIISDLPIFHQSLTHEMHVLKVPKRDVTKTARALRRLLTDTGLRDRLRQQGAMLMHELNVENRVNAAIALYQHILEA